MTNNAIKIPVRCAARCEGDQWTALCMTFDIAVQGDSFESVQVDLDKAICMYLESFEGLDTQEFLAAIKRPVPWRVAFGIYSSVIWHSVKSIFVSDKDNNLALYPSTCPV